MVAKAAALVLAIGIAACAHSTRKGPAVDGYAVQPSHVDPVVADRAPRVYWRGQWVRLVDGQWLYPTDRGWVMFTEEPADLARHRDSIDTEQNPSSSSPRGPTLKQAPGVTVGNQ